MHAHIHTRAHTHLHTHTHAHKNTRVRTYMARPQSHALMHIHACAYKNHLLQKHTIGPTAVISDPRPFPFPLVSMNFRRSCAAYSKARYRCGGSRTTSSRLFFPVNKKNMIFFFGGVERAITAAHKAEGRLRRAGGGKNAKVIQ